MDSDSLVRAWLVEALGASSSPTSVPEVARTVWERHEQELRSAGDLLFTWQLDLVSTAEAMAAEGRVLVDSSGRWSLVDGAVVPRVRRSWSTDEIAVAVEGYVAMLAAEHGGQPIRRSEVLAAITARTGRRGDQLEAMLCNISAVVQEHGLPPLSSHRPRSNVPAGVRPAVAAALGDLD